MVTVRDAVPEDLDAVAALTAQRRAAYEAVRPDFWRAAADADRHGKSYLVQLIDDTDVIVLVAETGDTLAGVLIGQPMNVPQVYDPGGPVYMIDDFTVSRPDYWTDRGAALLDGFRTILRTRGVVRLIAVCGVHDDAKADLFREAGLTTVSAWWTAGL